MTELNADAVRAIARLARLRLDEAETERMQQDLGRILEYFSALGRVDVSGATPTAHLLESGAQSRADEPQPGLERDEALKMAPDSGDGHYRVPRVLG